MTKPELDDLEAVRKIVDAIAGFDPSDQERILRWSREKIGLPSESTVSTRRVENQTPEEPTSVAQRTSTDIKSYVENKAPSSNTQFAATVAYYYRFEAPDHERKESINADDLQEACRLARRARMAKPAQTLIDALAVG